MKIIDGIIFRQMLISGANNLYNCYPEVDALNVFPVPDGDTGTNMNLTTSSGIKEIANSEDKNIYRVAKSFSRGLLFGARGNSGTILSQIFRGFAQGIKDKEEIDAIGLADAFEVGRQVAYKAVQQPVEGTILTVVREATDALSKSVYPDMEMAEAMEVFYKEAQASLKRTPDLLPVLKEVGVVDSGGAGFCKIIEGFLKALRNEIVEKKMPEVVEVPQSEVKEAGNVQAKFEHEEFGYCTEFILRLADPSDLKGKREFNEPRFKAVLDVHGNSIVAVHDGDLVKVHIHTLYPGNILSFAQQYGEFVKIKVENMSEQHSHLMEEAAKEEVKQAPKKKNALIVCCSGKGIEEMFKSQNADYIVSGGQTMNPSTEDFVKAVRAVNAENVFILPNNSNIVMAAKQAKEVVEDCNVIVIESKTIPQGMVASMMYNPEEAVEENTSEMKEALSSIKTGQVTFAIRDTSVDGVEVKKDDFIGIIDKKIVICEPDKFKVCYYLIENMVNSETSVITCFAGKDISDEELSNLEAVIKEKYESQGIDIDIKRGDQPVYSFIIGIE